MRVRKEDYYMDTFIIEGGHPLNGEVAISGAKNAVLGIIPAAILCSCSSKIDNVPTLRMSTRSLQSWKKWGQKYIEKMIL